MSDYGYEQRNSYQNENDYYDRDDPYRQPKSDPHRQPKSGGSRYDQDDIYSRTRPKNNRPDDPYSRQQMPPQQMPQHGHHSDNYRNSAEFGYNSFPKAPTVEYELDHLVTFTVSAKQNLLKPRDGMRRLREMETSTGIWTMRVRLILSQKEVVIVEKASGKELECFPISRICDPFNFTSTDPKDIYNNVVIFIVQGDPRTPSEMSAFQCIGKSGQELVDDLEAARSGKFPRRSAPPPNGRHVTPEYDDANASRGSSRASMNAEDSKSASEDDVDTLNRCFDCIEGFVASLQQAANAQKELQKRQAMRGNVDPKEEEFLRQRSQPPPTKEFVDPFQKFKLALNLLPKLKHMLKDPNAQELTHYLFSPLALVVDASRDPSGRPKLAQSVVSPLLLSKTCDLLGNCLHSAEMDLWHDLGDSWNVPSEKWVGPPPPAYVPKFIDRSKVAQPLDLHSRGNSEDMNGLPSQPVQNGQNKPNNAPPAAANPNRSSGESSSAQKPVSSPFLNDLRAKGAKIFMVKVSRTADANKAKELSVQAGEYVEVLDDTKNWWKVSNIHKQTGFVPKTILEQVQ